MQDLAQMNFQWHQEDSFLQLPCFLLPSPIHSESFREENETEVWFSQGQRTASEEQTEQLKDQMEAVCKALQEQKKEVYALLSSLHHGRFKRFASRQGKSLANERNKKKRIRKSKALRH